MSHTSVSTSSPDLGNPVALAAANTKFWDRIAKKYARTPIADDDSYQRKLAITREYLSPDSEVFEFGCGTGSTALLHAPYVKHIRAIDVSSGMLEIATAKAMQAGVQNVSFEQANIEAIALPEKSIDIVLGMSILHLVNDYEAVFRKVHRMLRANGVFVTSTPCLADGLWFLKPVLPIARWVGLAPKVLFFKREDLENSLLRSGFQIEQNWQPGPTKAAFIVARKI